MTRFDGAIAEAAAKFNMLRLEYSKCGRAGW
jgi:hypothetical protein